jgi:hypothetical protein
MARWRAKALERFPELRDVIASSDTVMAFWIELHLAFNDAYRKEPPDESLIARVYSFADWCDLAPRNPDAGRDPMTAVSVVFYEGIPRFKPARDDMPRWFRYSEVANNRQMFSYLIGDEEYEALVKYMAKNRHCYQPRESAEP